MRMDVGAEYGVLVKGAELKTNIEAKCHGARRHVHSLNAESKSVPCKNRNKKKNKK